MKCNNEFRAKARHKVVIETPTETSDDYGGFSVAWATQSTVWAMIKPMTGREVFQSEQLQSRVTHKFVIRYQSALKDTQTTAKYRINYDSRIFAVEYVRNLNSDMKNEGKDFQELLCVEGAPYDE